MYYECVATINGHHIGSQRDAENTEMQVFKDQPQPAHLPGQPWSIDEAATFLQVSERHLIRQIDSGKVKTIRLGRRRFVPDVELQRIATNGLE